MNPLRPIVVALGLCLLPLSAIAATDFTFTVRLPSALGTVNPPATKAVVVLDVGAGDPTSQTFTIDNFSGTESGTSTPQAVQVGAGWVGLDAGDRARADALPGPPNQVRITFDMKSWLASPFNLCAATVGIDPAARKKYHVTNGTLTPTAFRRSTYSAPARLNNPGGVPTNVQCTCAVRRVQENLFNFTSAPGVDNGPVPMDVVLVLDKSGSMAGKSNPADSAVKWALLQQAASMFIDSWTLYTGLPGTGSPADRLGLVYFDSAPQTKLFGGQFLVPRASGWGPIEADIMATGPGGATALGGGLRDGINQLFSSGNPDHFVLLLTDGLQNQSPMVSPETGLATIKTLDFGGGGGGVSNIYDKCVPVFTVGVGSHLEDVAGELLNAIGGQCAGEAAVVTGPSVPGVFGDNLRDMLTGNTLTLATRTTATLQAAPGPGPVTTVPLDSTAKALLVTASTPPAPGFGVPGMKLVVTAPDGKLVEGSCANLNKQRSALNYIVCRYPVKAAGDYKVQLERPLVVVAAPPAAVQYELAVYPIESSLDYFVGINQPKHHTGDRVQVDFNVTLDGKGVAGIADRIKVAVQRPGGALGTALHDSNASADPPGGDPDAPSAYFTKLQNLLKDPDAQRRLSPVEDPNVLAVTDLGNGNYSAAFTDTKVPGKYHFFTVLDFKNPANGETVRRQREIETAVAVLADPQQSMVTVAQPVGAPMVFTVVPRDKFTNYLGPGYGAGIVLKVNGQPIEAKIDDRGQTGSYTIPLVAPANATVAIEVNGASIGSKPVADWVNPKPPVCVGGCCCELGGQRGGDGTSGTRSLLAALLLLGAVVLRVRRRGARGSDSTSRSDSSHTGRMRG